MAVNKELMKGSSSTLVLKLLSRRDRYGYDLIKELERVPSGEILLSEGALYPILHSLENAREIESYWVEKADERRRKYYRITAAGKKKLQEREKEWKAFRTAVDRLLGGAHRGELA